MRAAVHRVERVDERVAARPRVERVRPATVTAGRSRDGGAFHHPARLRLVRDAAGPQSVAPQVVRADDVAVHVVHVHVLGQVERRCVRGKRVVREVALERDPVDDLQVVLRVEDREPGRRAGERHADDEPRAVVRQPLAAARVVRELRNAPGAGEIGPRDHAAAADAHALDRGAVADRNGDVARLAVVREHAEAALRHVARPRAERGGRRSEKSKGCESCNETMHGDPSCFADTATTRERAPRVPGQVPGTVPRTCLGDCPFRLRAAARRPGRRRSRSRPGRARRRCGAARAPSSRRSGRRSRRSDGRARRRRRSR